VKEGFLNKAKENLKMAKLSFDNECYNACANRAYYAAFQSAIEVLTKHGVHKGKNDHAWVQSEFNLRLIRRRKIFPAKFKTYLSDMMYIRHIADYSEKSISKRLADEQLSLATEMTLLIEKELNR